MSDVRLAFTTHRAALERTVLRTLGQGAAHRGVAERFDAVLLLGDRLLAAAAGGPYPSVPANLEKALAHLDRDPDGAAQEAAQVLEPALKLLLLHARPQEHARLAGDRRFNLFAVVRTLVLLDHREIELPLDEAGRIPDAVRRACLAAKEERNGVSHSGDVPSHASLVALVAAIDLHRDALRAALAPTVPRVPPLAGMEGFHVEYLHHGQSFVGREGALAALSDGVATLRDDGGYVLVHAPEGNGKSALVAAFARERARLRPLLGLGAPEATRRTPWLGGALIVFGKACAGRSPVEVAAALVRQANALLLERVPEPGSDATVAGARDGLQHALRRLADEVGDVVFVVDALDELGRDVLAVLPSHLGPGVVGVITCRSGHPVYPRVVDALRPRERPLGGLDPNETRALVVARAGVDDPEWCDRLHHVSDGAPLHVRIVADQLIEAGGVTAEVDPRAGFAPALQARVDRWRTPGLRMRDDKVRNALYVLSVLEPAGFVGWDDLGAILEHRGCDVRADELREDLAPHGSELLGIGADEVRLAARPLAEHVRDRVLSGKLLAAEVRRVAEALATLDPFPDELAAAFVLAWDEIGGPAADEASRVVEALASAERFDDLCDLAKTGMRGRAEASQTFVRALHLAAEADDDAACFLGLCLLQGLGMEIDSVSGREWLERAITSGNTQAQTMLGQLFMAGIGVPADAARAEALLTSAHEAGEIDASHALAVGLVSGHFGLVQSERAASVLRETAGNARTDVLLAALLSLGLAHPEAPDELARCVARIRDLGREGEEAVGWCAFYYPNFRRALADLGLVGADDGDALEGLQMVAQMGFSGAAVYLGVSSLDHDPEGALEQIRAAIVDPVGAVAAGELAAHDPRLDPLVPEIIDALRQAADVGTARAAGLGALLAHRKGDVATALDLYRREPNLSPPLRFARASLLLAADGQPVEARVTAALEMITSWANLGAFRDRIDPLDLVRAIEWLVEDGTGDQRATASASLASLAPDHDMARLVHDTLQDDAASRFAWVAEAVAGRAGLWHVAWLARFEADLEAYAAALVHQSERLPDATNAWLEVVKAFGRTLGDGESDDGELDDGELDDGESDDQSPPELEPEGERLLALFAEAASHPDDDPWWAAADADVGRIVAAAGDAFLASAPVWVRLAFADADARLAGAWLARHDAFVDRGPNLLALLRAHLPSVPAWLLLPAPPLRAR